jgi:hypothetical protein
MVDVTLICHGPMGVVASQKNSVVVSGQFKFSTRGSIYAMLVRYEPDKDKLLQLLDDLRGHITTIHQGELDFDGGRL